MNLAQLGLTLAGIVVCATCIGALAVLLTWRERAASSPERWQRLIVVVVPGAAVLLGVLLWTLLHVMLLWAPGAATAVAAR
ncbi:hypothetical protein K3G63_10570 [Hymenobacter sp. HSC-4F20]|uniref:hypothetical protein n=1 Tax=Hymenobacter sp. HSC-4F20 TaxID=2864135 RepID=UPI001C73575B|nr:hypothetical protein [Hymenobacter sp. HSC-4F20]MBX0290885.1 hypothetical protein [Hymenobacter sp. HSC-4F20]